MGGEDRSAGRQVKGTQYSNLREGDGMGPENV